MTDECREYLDAKSRYHNGYIGQACEACGSRNLSGCDGQFDCEACGYEMDLEMPEPPEAS